MLVSEKKVPIYELENKYTNTQRRQAWEHNPKEVRHETK